MLKLRKINIVKNKYFFKITIIFFIILFNISYNSKKKLINYCKDLWKNLGNNKCRNKILNQIILNKNIMLKKFKNIIEKFYIIGKFYKKELKKQLNLSRNFNAPKSLKV